MLALSLVLIGDLSICWVSYHIAESCKWLRNCVLILRVDENCFFKLLSLLVNNIWNTTKHGQIVVTDKLFYFIADLIIAKMIKHSPWIVNKHCNTKCSTLPIQTNAIIFIISSEICLTTQWKSKVLIKFYLSQSIKVLSTNLGKLTEPLISFCILIRPFIVFKWWLKITWIKDYRCRQHIRKVRLVISLVKMVIRE